jgi:CRP/FNR family cyclic AMP-dependent transcriptional regulator
MAASLPVRHKGPPLMPLSVSEILVSSGVVPRVVEFKKCERIFSQGDSSKTIFHIQKGAVKLSFVNQNGKEAVLAVLGPDDFFGEGCLAAQAFRSGSATAVVPTVVLVIEKVEMNRVLHANAALTDRFISYMLSSYVRSEEYLTDQLLNSV